LQSELQNVHKSLRVSEEKLSSFKWINDQNQWRNDLKGNLLLPNPEYNEIRKSLDFDLEALVIPDVKSWVSLEPMSTAETEYADLEDAEAVNESQVSNKNFPVTKEKLEKSDTLNFKAKLAKNSLQSRNISLQSNDNVATANLSDTGECAGRKDWCDIRDFSKSKVQTIPKTVIVDPYVLTDSNDWYRKKKSEAVGTLKSRVFKVYKERGGGYSDKICSLYTSQSLDLGRQYKEGNISSNNCMSGSTIRSMWL